MTDSVPNQVEDHPLISGGTAKIIIVPVISCPSINEIRGTGEFLIRKCEFLCKSREIKGSCGAYIRYAAPVCVRARTAGAGWCKSDRFSQVSKIHNAIIPRPSTRPLSEEINNGPDKKDRCGYRFFRIFR